MKPIKTSEQLPTERQRCLWYHSRHQRWYFGVWTPELDRYTPGVFIGEVNGYVCDGIATHWMPEPDAPGEEK